MAFNNFGSDDDKLLVYDLRQIYAKEIVGETLKAIAFARKSNDFPLWYHLLKRDLFTEISHKLESDEKKQLKKLIIKTRDILTKNEQAYINKSKDSNEHEAVENALTKLERCLLKLMEKHKMFGSKDDDEGL